MNASQSENTTKKLTYQSLVLRLKEECSCNDWHDGVLKYYEGCSKSAKDYPGPSGQSENVMSTFGIFLNKLLDLTASNSTILSSSSTAILDAMSSQSELGGSFGHLLNECIKSLPQLSDDLRKIISNLSYNIGPLTTCLMNDAITDLEHSIRHFAAMLQNSGVEHFGNSLGMNLDYEPVTLCAQVLMNMIALIAETTLYNCKIATHNIFESLTVLTLISNWYLIGAHSVNVVSQGILRTASQPIPEKLNVSLVAVAPLLQPMADVIDAIDEASEENLVHVLKRLVDFTVSMNSKLDPVFGLFEGVATSVGQITEALLIVAK